MAARHARQTLIATALAALTLGGCRTPSINLSTNQPIKVDIAMRLDVYQYDGESGNPTSARDSIPEKRGKNRQADIQTFKNSRVVGEDRNGLLVVLKEISGEQEDHLRQIVAEENSDRMALMKARAEKEKRSLIEIQKEQAALWVNRSFKGEWIEVAGSDGKYRWVQKQG